MSTTRTLLKSTAETIASITVVGGAVLWGWNYVGKPWAQELITDTVNERLSTVERTQRTIVEDIGKLVASQKAETRQSAGEADATRQILCLLKAQNGMADAQECEQ